MRSLEYTAKPCPGSEAAHEQPLSVNGENSRAKVQNLRGDSSAEKKAAEATGKKSSN